LSIAETLGVPVVTTLDAKGSVREDHPQVLGVFGIFGRPGMEASAKLVTTASTIVSFGVDDHTQLIFLNKAGSQTAHLVQINHAALHDLRFKTAHLLAGDIACIAERLLDEICLVRAHSTGEGLQSHALSENEVTTIDLDTSPQNYLIDEAQPTLSAIHREITWGSTSTINRFAAEAAHQRPCTYQVPKDEIKAGSCHPGLVMSRLSNILQEGAIVSIDAGESSLWASLCLCLKRNDQRAITSMRLGTQGYSVYGAIGSAAFNPNVTLVGITDDRSFQFAMNELPTLRQMQATVVFIIFSTSQTLHGNHIPTPDFCKVAKAHGGQGIRLDESDTNVIDQSLQNAFRNTGLTLVEVVRDVAVEPLKRRPNIVTEITQSSISKKHAWVLE
jgi:thiamine pyrophosphate-dependent acetolactate synthase large subunit-like protein